VTFTASIKLHSYVSPTISALYGAEIYTTFVIQFGVVVLKALKTESNILIGTNTSSRTYISTNVLDYQDSNEDLGLNI
jgi:hypothetical protein